METSNLCQHNCSYRTITSQETILLKEATTIFNMPIRTVSAVSGAPLRVRCNYAVKAVILKTPC